MPGKVFKTALDGAPLEAEGSAGAQESEPTSFNAELGYRQLSLPTATHSSP
jgi:hypothetical protein